MYNPYGIRSMPCTCGHNDARLIVCGAGSYVRCPWCNRSVYMCNTKEDAERMWSQKPREERKEYGMIQEIELSKLRIHPKNVRKTYSNIEELADSIKSKGILQNLTVVKNPDEEGTYWVVIGNRRLTAAKIAGIETAPCQIVEMDEKDQASTMLLENMQRSDLTIHEQAYGIQMVLDLGETEESLSEKTGLSKNTIRHRSNIAKLDQDVLQKKEKDVNFQLTLKDLYELEKIPDIKMRNKILKEATDSNNLASRAKNCVEDMKRKKNEKKFLELFKSIGIQAAPKEAEHELYSGKWETVKEFELSKEAPKSVGISKEEREKCFYITYWRSIRIIKKKAKVKKELTPEEKAQKEHEKRIKQIKAIQKEMAAEREDFIRVAIEKKFKPDKLAINSVERRLLNLMLDCECWMSKGSTYKILFDKEKWEVKDEEEKERYRKSIDGLSMHYLLFVLAAKSVADKNVTEWNGEYHKKNGALLLEFEDILEDFGFSYSNQEYKKVSNGTHELYEK